MSATTRPLRPLRYMLRAECLDPANGMTKEAAAVRYAARLAADMAEASARGWTVLTFHYPEAGMPAVPYGQPPEPGERWQELPDYANGGDGGYLRTTVSEAVP